MEKNLKEVVGRTITHYAVLEKLGEGGMGVVYKARDQKLDRLVAIKVLSPHLAESTEYKARLIQEAKAAAALNHANILGIHEINEEEGSFFLVMEFVEGETLRSYLNGLATGTGLPVTKAADWIIQIADGLSAAHQKGIVHRDIKSENIMIDQNGRLKVMDFGLARLKTGTGITKTGASLGTLSYMSPEQAQGLPADHRSDIWSLGVVFFEMLTGEVPFKSEHEAGLLYLIVNQDAISPSELDKKIPRQLDQVVMKMLAKDRDRRYQSLTDFIQDLKEARARIENAATTQKAKGIVVLPFGNISQEKESDYFSDGLTEELIANLSRLKDIRLVPRATSMQYKGTTKDLKAISRELDTRYILSGSVRKFQDNIRITVELIDVETDAQLWAETYKGTMADVFDIQEQVSKQIVEALMVKLTPTEKVVLAKRSTSNPEAFDCNLRARGFLYRRTKNAVQFAIQLFQQAIELDARYAAAYAGLGEAYATMHHDYDSKELWLDKAIESSLKALMYDPSLSEAYAALGLSYFSKKSIDEAITSSQKAIELDPNNFTAYWILGRIYHATDRDKEAIGLYKKAIELNPDFHTAYGDLRMIYERLGEKEKYNETLNALLEMFPRYLSKYPDDARSHIYYATDLAQVGRIDEAKVEAQKALQLSPGDPLMLYNAACCYARMGETKQAVDALRESIAVGLEDYEWIKRDPDLETIRDDPGFKELLKGK
ncbi:MAG: protein kinase [Ignavibacteria bacterium]|nr:protein kinase [Ignavibacteria bacterium]